MSRTSGRGGFIAISGGSPVAVPSPAAWKTTATDYVLDDIVTVGTGNDAVQAICIENHKSTATNGLTVSSGELSGADADKWDLLNEDGELTALTEWSFDDGSETGTQGFVRELRDRTIPGADTVTGTLVVAEDQFRDVAQQALKKRNTFTMTLYPASRKDASGDALPAGEKRTYFEGVVLVTSVAMAYSNELQVRTINWSAQGEWVEKTYTAS